MPSMTSVLHGYVGLRSPLKPLSTPSYIPESDVFWRRVVDSGGGEEVLDVCLWVLGLCLRVRRTETTIHKCEIHGGDSS